jgi:RHH-type proline utilization regulon transcriptional repressor/proline dehydrogenase/delta 1-pyrroline-5-carboxylate dehydrogenase
LRGRALTREERAELAETLAYELVAQSQTRTDRADRTRMRMLSRLMRDPLGQALTTSLTDRLYRAKSAERVMDEVAHLIELLGLPSYMRPIERVELGSAGILSKVVPSLIARAVIDKVRSETRAVLLSANPKALSEHLARRHRENVRVNVNQLGEALLGEHEAELRVQKYEALASRDDIDAVSVKVSSVGSQLNLLAFEQTTATLAERMERIYRATLKVPEDRRPLVMLDMEAYNDIELTFAVMERALAHRDMDRVRAGVVLQAYLPDSHAWHQHLIHWASERVARGGVPVRLRIVKGANLAQERVDSARNGAAVPIFARKEEVDASYKLMLERAIVPQHLSAVRVGVASHNLFDIGYALALCAEHDAFGEVGFEVLEGMADPLRRTLSALGADVLVYAPVCGDDEMNNGIAYLVRRLDENTSSDNFLRSSFEMRPGDASFRKEQERFRNSVALLKNLDTRPRRSDDPSHDRSKETPRKQAGRDFVNESDTDFSRPENRAYVQAALAQLAAQEPAVVRSCIAGQWVSGTLQNGEDPSRPGAVPYRFALASANDIERALACAHEDPSRFSQTSASQRAHLLRRVAEGLRKARAELIAAMLMDAGKRVQEADAEISEAVDFAEYYRANHLRMEREEAVELSARGVVVVTPPWNFPLAIPAGGVLAALMAGNRVILKPALETPYVAEKLVRILWEAGIPKEALQFVVTEDEVASQLIRDRRVDTVVLTGATSTARLFQRLRPGLRLLAETGGKNAYIVSTMSDRELAIYHAIHSAFGHAGQKCSAASLLILEAEVYDDPGFMETLQDAVQSLAVGSAWDPVSFVTPLIREPEGALARGLSTLDPGESWLVAPRVDPNNPRLISPAVKLGVKEGSFSHTNEMFGPVLSVMRADDLRHAIALANATGYGLTAGLASLDEREHKLFLDTIRAGNVYVNRTITGAIVERQPFGGLDKSGYGPGAKAGGPNYVAQLAHVRALREPTEPRLLSETAHEVFSHWSHALPAQDSANWQRRAANYDAAYAREIARLHDRQALLGQDNLLRYRPFPQLVLRVTREATLLDLASSLLCADLVGTRLQLSIDPSFAGPKDSSALGHPAHVETAAQLLARAPTAARIRVLGRREPELDALNEKTGAHIADEIVSEAGRFELLHYVREQSLSIDYHRYGNLGARALTKR